MSPVLEVMSRQQIILAHDFNDIGGSHLSHSHQTIIQPIDFLVKFDARSGHLVEISRVIGIALSSLVLDNDCLDILVSKDGSDAASSCLLDPWQLSSQIIERKVKHAHIGVFCG